MIHRIQRMIRNESGATAIEYCLLATLIGFVIVAGAGSLGTALGARFEALGTAVSSAPTSGAH
ncbi:Flp family type IVb pilin [Aureimonas pseudogalii]|uniref:Pilus assembly protein Flp/PilA n=1 Tax=Aureimonas pseudogalii TaxID=1744844 RepID=A0A7W6EBV3_9HYPH|nr:Flp family type IVb pilin [Aureimonas pseudogalii]MBB3998437.1 pilus assembly protein Flp/PilA [Aureimonas pseudogalii]